MIKTLIEVSNNLFLEAKARAIAIPVDLDSQVNTLSLKVHSTMVQRAAKDWRISARSRPRKEPLGCPDYRNIIEKLQVQFHGLIQTMYIQMVLFIIDEDISFCVQGVVSLLEEQFSPKVQAEFSVLVDVLHSPELLFPEAAQLCESGAFMSK